MKPVIDISEFQNATFDYKKVGEQIEYAIIRVGGTGYGASHNVYQDSLFEKHYDGFTKAGVKLGVYFFAGAMNKAGVDKEVALVKKALANKKIDYPVYYDIEVESYQGEHGNLSKSKRTELAVYFCKEIEKLGYKAGVYTGISFWAYGKLDMTKFENYAVWIAQYNSFCQYTLPYDLWQYGPITLEGYPYQLDGNKIIERVQNMPEPNIPEPEPVVSEPEPEPAPAPQDSELQNDPYYVVVAGDTLSKIAERFGTTYQELARLNGIANPNLIYVGQKLMLPKKEEEPVEEKPVEEKPATTKPKKYIWYKVKAGDTLSGIAQKYKTSVPKLVKDNKIVNPNVIFVGQKLKVYKGIR